MTFLAICSSHADEAIEASTLSHLIRDIIEYNADLENDWIQVIEVSERGVTVHTNSVMEAVNWHRKGAAGAMPNEHLLSGSQLGVV